MGEERNELDLTYPLHKTVFHGNLRELSALLRTAPDVSKKDPHGTELSHTI